MSDRLKGPWRILPRESKAVAENLIIGPDGRWQVMVFNQRADNFEECENITRIIAALPDTLVEVQQLRDRVSHLEDELQRLSRGSVAEVAASNSSVMDYAAHWEARVQRAEGNVERLREALLQVLVDIQDPHPRMATLEGYRDAMRATADMVSAVLNGKAVDDER